MTYIYIYLCCLYSSPKFSTPCSNFILFDLLNTEISKYNQLGKVIILGDFNSRIGNYDKPPKFDRNDPIAEYCFDTSGLFDFSAVPSRRTSDFITDGFGTKLIELLNCNNLLVLNGRSKSDMLEASCSYMKRSAEGAVVGGSIVDYCIINPELLPSVRDFCISYSHLDDPVAHGCLNVEMNVVGAIDRVFVSGTSCLSDQKKYRWVEGKIGIFRKNCNSNAAKAIIEKLNDTIDNLVDNDRNNLDTVCVLLEKYYSVVSGYDFVCVKSSVETKNQPSWWNKDCQNNLVFYHEELNPYNRFRCDKSKNVMKTARNKI